MRSDRSYNVIRELQGTLGSTVSTSFFISGEPEASDTVQARFSVSEAGGSYLQIACFEDRPVSRHSQNLLKFIFQRNH